MAFIVLNILSCTVDKVQTVDYRIKNSSPHNLDFITITNGSEKIITVNKDNNTTLGNFDISEQVFPFKIIDSVIVKFSDNKNLKYKKTDDCNSGKSFFCSTNTSCIDKVCTFEIDSLEYKKAQ
jgi:hypothetical protein